MNVTRTILYQDGVIEIKGRVISLSIYTNSLEKPTKDIEPILVIFQIDSSEQRQHKIRH